MSQTKYQLQKTRTAEDRASLLKGYLREAATLSPERAEGLRELWTWLTKHTDYLTAPASGPHHNNYEGGLFDHSENVYETATFFSLRLREFKEIYIDQSSLIIASFFHDLCKVNRYGPTQKFTKKEGEFKWRKYQQYGTVRNDFPAGHGPKSALLLLRNFPQVTNEELLAVTHHLGPWDIANTDGWATKYDFEEAMKIPLVQCIVAGDVTSFVVEEAIDYRKQAESDDRFLA